jgi:dihydrofolate synthase/folylpolyglutamate synthase
MADKDYNYMADRIASVAEKVFCLTPDNPRALSAEEYAKVFAEKGIPSVACASVLEAVEAAFSWAKKKDKPIISLGSLYMYCEVVRAIKKHN